MQTLGLSSSPQPTDNIFKRLLWPAVESQYDVDLLGQQGFWVCTIVATLSLVLMLALRMPITGLITAIVFFLGGCGVRERSIPSALLVFVLYLWNLVGGIILGSFGNPLLQIVILMLLFANIRATILSRRWVAEPFEDGENELPERSNSSLSERFANRLPEKLWPTGKYVFFPLAIIVLLLSVVGTAMNASRAHAATMLRPENSTTINVAPTTN